MSNNINNNAQTNYFDLHLTGMAYLSRMRKVEGRFDPYYSVTLAFRQGKAEEKNYVFVDTVIRGKKALDALLPLMDKINDRDSAVYGIMTASDIYQETYANKDGKVMPSMKGRLIGLKTLSVNGEKIELPESEYSESQEDQAQPEATIAEAEVIQEPVVEAPVIEADAEEQVLVVKLDPQDPDFKAKKADLKADGYRWNRQLVAWTKAA